MKRSSIIKGIDSGYLSKGDHVPNISPGFARVCMRGLKKDRLIRVLADHFAGVAELDELDDTRTHDERVLRAIQVLSNEELINATFGGFQDRYSQWVYCRNLDSTAIRYIARDMQGLEGQSADADVAVLRYKSIRRGWHSILLQVKQELNCGVRARDSVQVLLQQREVLIPCLLTVGQGKLFIQVMTVNPDDWKPFLGEDVVQTYGTIKHEAGRDLALSYVLGRVGFRSPSPFDYSDRARVIVDSDGIHVADVAGHFILSTTRVGDIRIEAAMSTDDEMSGVESIFNEEFRKIMRADSIRSARIQARNLVFGIPEGRSLTIMPMEGRIQIGSMFEGGDIYALLDFLAS
jgi:hypothetical protein